MSKVVRMQDPPPMTNDEAKNYAPPDRRVHPDTIRALDAITRTSHERDALIEENRALKAALDIEREKSAMLAHQLERTTDDMQRRLDQTTSDKDYFQRHTTMIVTQLNTVGTLIGQVMDAARKAAEEMPATKPPIDQAKIEANLGEEIAEPEGQ